MHQALCIVLFCAVASSTVICSSAPRIDAPKSSLLLSRGAFFFICVPSFQSYKLLSTQEHVAFALRKQRQQPRLLMVIPCLLTALAA